ncbi:FAD:protein FMN transferase [Namhaeicola litoreus]|uniref:FAD:protein FMN transferase n=1 Tax=Namhaeicola litoreus TaxID=1052145 RepID=A0ABW3XYC8_9FLAO
MTNFFLYFLMILLISCKSDDKTYQRLSGNALGTTFSAIYDDAQQRNFEKEIDSLFHMINQSLSTYIPNSDISKINSGDTLVQVDHYFEEVFQKSLNICEETGGYFDPTIGLLVNAWGFGPGDGLANIDSAKIESLLQGVGLHKINLVNGKIKAKYTPFFLDFNAIAKGYTVDVLGRFLESKEIENYLVEIGGEVRTRGKNERGLSWKIAIEKPHFDGSRSYQSFVLLSDESIATSGNYRKFKIDSITGARFAHTIDTKTGYPSKSDLLSASVISSLDCADVDAYATAFMAMGFEKTKAFLANKPELKVFLIYEKDGELMTYNTDNLEIEFPGSE